MSKIIAALTIVSLCIGVASATAASPTSQMSTVSPSLLNSTATKVYSGTNTTSDYTSSTWSLVNSNINNVVYGPSTTNGTIYAYGLVYSSNFITKVIRRSLNATILGYGNDTTEMSVIGTDLSITTNPVLSNSHSFSVAVGPGYLAILSKGAISSIQQVQVTIINPSGTVTTTTVTANTGTYSIYYIGNIFYEMGSAAFFYTYTATTKTSQNALCVGGIYANGTAYWATPLNITLTVPADSLQNPVVGGDNYTNASYIYVAYKDSTAGISYYSKTAKATTVTAAGMPTALVTDTASGTYPNNVFVPIGVWASNYTYGIACSNVTTASSGGTVTYYIANFLNGTTTGADSGLSFSGAAYAPTGLWGWQLNTGYTLLGMWPTSSSSSPNTYVMGTFYANGTVNMSSAILAASLQGPFNTFEDVNGTEWVGWTDIDTANSLTYNGYVAKLQGQLNPASTNTLKAIMAFVAFCLAAVFAF